VSSERTKVTFNIPLTNIKRGYNGFNSKYPAKSEFKRVSNVWTDIPELMRPERNTQKPIALMERIIQTHTNPGDLVVDTFCGWGTTGVAALKLGRVFLGCERIPEDAKLANERCLAVISQTNLVKVAGR
jgi:DNA modification methylase